MARIRTEPCGSYMVISGPSIQIASQGGPSRRRAPPARRRRVAVAVGVGAIEPALEQPVKPDLLEAGRSREEVMSITDQSEAMVKHYAGRQYKRTLAKSAILKLEDVTRKR